MRRMTAGLLQIGGEGTRTGLIIGILPLLHDGLLLGRGWVSAVDCLP